MKKYKINSGVLFLVDKNWLIVQEELLPDKKDFYESIFSLGNGYMGVRGFFEDELNKKSYEVSTFIAGVYDYIKNGITDMVNTPNFFSSRLVIDGEEFDYESSKICEFTRILNMKEGCLTKSLIWEHGNGHKTRIETIRLLSIVENHLAALQYKIIPLNYTGNVLFETGIDGRVTNNPISDDQLKNEIDTMVLLQHKETGCDNDISFLSVSTNVMKYEICEAFTVCLRENGEKKELFKIHNEKNGFISKKISFEIHEMNEYVVDKLIGVYTSRDKEVLDIKNAAVSLVKKASELGFNYIFDNNLKAWEEKWNTADVIIDGDYESQLGIRYNIFQLIQTNAETDENVSIGARGIMHGRYKGCYFWDTEIFMLPFYIYTNPKAAKNLLMYRYNTLWGAEQNAKGLNLEGARYAWMCSIDGKEQCETWDTGCCEIHITADVAYAINNYFQVTLDEEFVKNYGAEIYIKTAQYWKSRFTYQKEKDIYNMLFVKGPNEYGGVTVNSTYTSIMAINNFKFAIESVEMLKVKDIDFYIKLKKKIGFDESEMLEWKDIIDKAVINYDSEQKLYIEDDNFLKLEHLDVRKFKTDETPLYHKIGFDRLQRYMVLKQADVLLLMTLLPEMFTYEEKMAAWSFYEPITLHDSTLSFGTHALFAAKCGLSVEAYKYFYKSVRLDMDDIMGNTGKEGIHFASFGASWQALINGFGGVGISDGMLDVRPILPEMWTLLKFKVIFRGNILKIIVTQENIEITLLDCEENIKQLDIKVYGSTSRLIKANVSTFIKK